LSGHMKLLDQAKASVLDVDAKSMTRLNDSPTEDAEPLAVRVNA
jgi:hypothetical protein